MTAQSLKLRRQPQHGPGQKGPARSAVTVVFAEEQEGKEETDIQKRRKHDGALGNVGRHPHRIKAAANKTCGGSAGSQ